MSESMLWALLGHVASGGNDLFQYIVTTSTEPVEAFRHHVRLSSPQIATTVFFCVIVWAWGRCL
jgi:hypothetical protein